MTGDKKPAAAMSTNDAKRYHLAIQRTARMVEDHSVQKLAAQHGLQVLNVTWEDTGRFKGSAVGPNISDMTIQVQHQPPGTDRWELTCMPVIRPPNFSDVTGDISPDLFFVLVGNEKGEPLRKITLRELLENLRRYLSAPESWKGDRTSLLAPDRDSHVLVSTQACFLPVPRAGIATFNPVLFNYQSVAGDPAVLAILATREGTSVTIIDNQRDAFAAGSTWGQRLFFNQNGQRASFTGQRKSDFLTAEMEKPPAQTGSSADGLDREGLNMMLLIQVPLKQKERMRFGGTMLMEGIEIFCCCMAGAGAADVEEAVIGHGEIEGPFTEIDDLEVERDDRFPIRVTVQFYKATSNGVVAPEDMADLAGQIELVYREADYVGSLVLEESERPTEHGGQKFESPEWWGRFWERHLANTGQTREEAVQMLETLLGHDWSRSTEAEAEAAVQQAEKERQQ